MIQDDVLCLPAKISALYGNIGQFVVCLRVTTSIHLINPATLQSEYLQLAPLHHTAVTHACQYRCHY